MPIPRTLNHNFFKTWTPEMAYVLGFFAADGSMLKNNRGAHFVEFTITDRVVLEHIKKAIGSNHTLATRERGGNCKTAYRLQIGSKQWFIDLTRLGFTQRKSKTLKFPKIPKRFVGHFIRGYFDGDGCVYFKQHFVKALNRKKWIFSTRFTSGSKNFLVSLLAALRLCGCERGFIVEKSHKSGYDLVFSHRDSLALYQLIYHTGSTAAPWLPRKYLLFTKAIKALYGSSYTTVRE